MEDYIIYSEELQGMIAKAGIDIEVFIRLSKAEQFTQAEVDDLEYMFDKLEIYQDYSC